MARFNGIAFALAMVITSACSKAESEPAPEAASASEPAPRQRGPVAQIDLCSLVTQAEAEAILEKKLNPPEKQPGGDCWYLREGGSGFGSVEFILSTITGQVSSPAEFDAMVADQVKRTNANVKKSGLNIDVFSAERAPGVGAPAYFIDPGLYVLKGNTVLAVALGGAKGVAVAKTALARMP